MDTLVYTIRCTVHTLNRRYGVPVENMVFRDSVFLHRFFAIGSGTASGVRNITVENCQMGALPTDGYGLHYGTSPLPPPHPLFY